MKQTTARMPRLLINLFAFRPSDTADVTMIPEGDRRLGREADLGAVAGVYVALNLWGLLILAR